MDAPEFWVGPKVAEARAGGLLVERRTLSAARDMLGPGLIYVGIAFTPTLQGSSRPDWRVYLPWIGFCARTTTLTLMHWGRAAIAPVALRCEIPDKYLPSGQIGHDDDLWLARDVTLLNYVDLMVIVRQPGWDRCRILHAAASALLATNRRVVLIGSGE